MYISKIISRKNISLMSLIVIFSLTISILSSCSKQEQKQTKVKQTSIVREGIIDVKAIDANNDGFVFQCPMDWNVISDDAGKCTVCGMNLEKYTIKEAKENLISHKYKTK